MSVFVSVGLISASGTPCIIIIRRGEDGRKKKEKSFTSIQMLHTHRGFYTRTLLHTDTFTHMTLLHTETFTQKRFYTQTLLDTNAFRHRDFYTQTLLHTDAFTHRSFYTQTLLHTEVFTHRSFYILRRTTWK